jgi:hypothetical protein
VVDGNGLENRRGETHREFESRPLRHVDFIDAAVVVTLLLQLLRRS